MEQHHNIVGKYRLGKVLGTGDFDCTIRTCTHIVHGNTFAVRVYSKAVLSEKGSWQQLAEAVQVVRTLPRSDRIVETVECFETQSFLYILMAFAKGASLYKILVLGPTSSDPEVNISLDLNDKRTVFNQFLQGLQHLHSHDVAHMGLAPDHVLIHRTRDSSSSSSTTANTNVTGGASNSNANITGSGSNQDGNKNTTNSSSSPTSSPTSTTPQQQNNNNSIAAILSGSVNAGATTSASGKKFSVRIGFLVACKKVEPGQKMLHLCGTTHTVAPEVLRQTEPYDPFLADIWSAGVVLYFMLSSGKYPFDGANTSKHILAHDVRPLDPAIPAEARELVHWMMSPDPARRPSLQQVMDHPWLSDRHHMAKNAQAIVANAVNCTRDEKTGRILLQVNPLGLSRKELAARIIQAVWRLTHYRPFAATNLGRKKQSMRVTSKSKKSSFGGGESWGTRVESDGEEEDDGTGGGDDDAKSKKSRNKIIKQQQRRAAKKKMLMAGGEVDSFFDYDEDEDEEDEYDDDFEGDEDDDEFYRERRQPRNAISKRLKLMKEVKSTVPPMPSSLIAHDVRCQHCGRVPPTTFQRGRHPFPQVGVSFNSDRGFYVKDHTELNMNDSIPIPAIDVTNSMIDFNANSSSHQLRSSSRTGAVGGGYGSLVRSPQSNSFNNMTPAAQSLIMSQSQSQSQRERGRGTPGSTSSSRQGNINNMNNNTNIMSMSTSGNQSQSQFSPSTSQNYVPPSSSTSGQQQQQQAPSSSSFGSSRRFFQAVMSAAATAAAHKESHQQQQQQQSGMTKEESSGDHGIISRGDSFSQAIPYVESGHYTLPTMNLGRTDGMIPNISSSGGDTPPSLPAITSSSNKNNNTSNVFVDGNTLTAPPPTKHRHTLVGADLKKGDSFFDRTAAAIAVPPSQPFFAS